MQLAAIACFLLALAWILVLLQEAIWRKLKNTDKKKLATDVTLASSNALLAIQAKTAEYAPVAQKAAMTTFTRLSPLFSFQGSSGRKSFLLTQIGVGLFLGLSVIVYAWLADSRSKASQNFGVAVILLAMMLSIWVLAAVSARRTRDSGVSVWWVLTLLIPPINLAATVFLFVVPTNEFTGKGF